jgi:hypothetical protein
MKKLIILATILFLAMIAVGQIANAQTSGTFTYLPELGIGFYHSFSPYGSTNGSFSYSRELGIGSYYNFSQHGNTYGTFDYLPELNMGFYHSFSVPYNFSNDNYE